MTENIEKELEKDRLKRYIENIYREIKQNEEKIVFHEELLKDLALDEKCRIENHDIIMNNFKPVNPQWLFETNETYLENLVKLQGLIKKKDILTYSKNREQINTAITLAKEQLESLNTALNKFNEDHKDDNIMEEQNEGT